MQLTVTLIDGTTLNIDLDDSTIITSSLLRKSGIDSRQIIHIDIPDGVTEIEMWAFGCCTSLASVTIPNGVTSIGGWAFRGCTSLASVTILYSVTSIAGQAFQGCTSLISIKIPDSVISIGGRAFQNCTSLVSITIPNSVKEIEPKAFEGCTGLERIIVHTAAQQQMLLNSESGITDDQIVCLPELTKDEGNRKKYGTTYSGFAALNPQEQDLYLTALYEYRAQPKNAASTDASGGESKAEAQSDENFKDILNGTYHYDIFTKLNENTQKLYLQELNKWKTAKEDEPNDYIELLQEISRYFPGNGLKEDSFASYLQTKFTKHLEIDPEMLKALPPPKLGTLAMGVTLSLIRLTPDDPRKSKNDDGSRSPRTTIQGKPKSPGNICSLQ